MEFRNSYEDNRRARAYNELEFGGTYLLAFKNLPKILAGFVTGRRALDFGCGSGRSTRFLKQQGFEAIGVDVSREMVTVAQERDPAGDYRVIEDGDFSSFPAEMFDLVFSAFTFDNIPSRNHKIHLFSELNRLLKHDGVLLNMVSTPEIYTNEWVTFTTKDFLENQEARCGDIVRIITKDYSDSRPVEDILWPDEDYQLVYKESDLIQAHSEAPLASGDEDVDWISETTIAPWRIYVLRPKYSDPQP